MIHIVTGEHKTTTRILGVFSTFDKAVEFIKSRKQSPDLFYWVESWMIDVPGTCMVSTGETVAQSGTGIQIDAERD